MIWTVLGRIALGTWLATAQADATLTGIALQHGAHENNPLIGTAPAWVLPIVKGASAGTAVWYTEKYRKDHPKAVFWVAAAATGFYAYANVHNLGVIRLQERHGR